jgi:UDP-N-acetylmuramoyl-L-alanyl-D-glutamate--2,6-diaminopimelate ligase
MAAVELGMDSLETLRLLSELESVSGRFNTLFLQILRLLLIMLIPDALENVLKQPMTSGLKRTVELLL